MKNKKFASLLLSLGLIGAIGTGATLAYLSDQTDNLTNKFTFVENGINIDLWETKVDSDTHVPTQDKVVAGNNAGNDYNNVVANEQLTKNPTIDVKADSVDCYVFASITKGDDKVSIVDLDSDWKVLETVGSTTYYVYAKGGTETLVNKSATDTTLTPLFTKVKIANNIVANTDLSANDIVIKASAVQAEKIDGVFSYNKDVEKAGLALLKK